MAAPAPGGSPVAPRARGHRNKDTLLRKAVAHVETGLDHVHRLTPQVWPQTRWRHWALEGMTQLPLTMEPDLRWSETFTKVRSLTPRECLAEELGASPLLAGARRRRFYVPANFLPSLPAISVPESVALKAEQLKARLPKMPTHYFKRRMPQMPVEPVDKAD